MAVVVCGLIFAGLQLGPFIHDWIALKREHTDFIRATAVLSDPMNWYEISMQSALWTLIGLLAAVRFWWVRDRRVDTPPIDRGVGGLVHSLGSIVGRTAATSASGTRRLVSGAV